MPAAWLIEQAGFTKGYAIRRGRAISSRHTLALINRGGAKAADILALAQRISSAVEVRFGVCLEMEPVLGGILTNHLPGRLATRPGLTHSEYDDSTIPARL